MVLYMMHERMQSGRLQVVLVFSCTILAEFPVNLTPHLLVEIQHTALGNDTLEMTPWQLYDPFTIPLRSLANQNIFTLLSPTTDTFACCITCGNFAILYVSCSECMVMMVADDGLLLDSYEQQLH